MWSLADHKVAGIHDVTLALMNHVTQATLAFITAMYQFTTCLAAYRKINKNHQGTGRNVHLWAYHLKVTTKLGQL